MSNIRSSGPRASSWKCFLRLEFRAAHWLLPLLVYLVLGPRLSLHTLSWDLKALNTIYVSDFTPMLNFSPEILARSPNHLSTQHFHVVV